MWDLNTLVACRASALFTQDLEDIGEFIRENGQKNIDVKKISEAQTRLLYGKAKEKGITNEALHKMINEITGKDSVKDIDRKELETLLKAIEDIK